MKCHRSIKMSTVSIGSVTILFAFVEKHKKHVVSLPHLCGDGVPRPLRLHAQLLASASEAGSADGGARVRHLAEGAAGALL